jgi:hypothetical protein
LVFLSKLFGLAHFLLLFVCTFGKRRRMRWASSIARVASLNTLTVSNPRLSNKRQSQLSCCALSHAFLFRLFFFFFFFCFFYLFAMDFLSFQRLGVVVVVVVARLPIFCFFFIFFLIPFPDQQGNPPREIWD